MDFAIISDPTISADEALNRANYHEYPEYTGKVCQIKLNLEGKGKEFHWYADMSMIELSDFPPDPVVAARISGYLEKLDKLHSTVIGKTLTAMDTRRKSVRTGENSFGNLLADILRDFYKSDVALINGGGIRGDREYQAGSILTRGDLHRELPFNNRITNIIVTGRQLKAGIENGLSRIQDEKGRFPHVSGMRIKYNSLREPLQRVTEITIGGKPVDLEKTYTLATLDYIASGGSGYSMFKDSERLVKIGGGKLLWEYIMNHILEKKEIAPSIDDRLHDIRELSQ